jgi:hypothetical protein
MFASKKSHMVIESSWPENRTRASGLNLLYCRVPSELVIVRLGSRNITLSAELDEVRGLKFSSARSSKGKLSQEGSKVESSHNLAAARADRCSPPDKNKVNLGEKDI